MTGFSLMPRAPTEFLFSAWRTLSPIPGGKAVFSILLGVLVPYSGTLHARVTELSEGVSNVTLRQRWRILNHLGSIHAMALANVCELSSGLALLSRLGAHRRGILTGFKVSYLKKARGTLHVRSDARPITLPEEGEVEVCATGYDSTGDIVVRADATWRIGAVRSTEGKAVNGK